MGGHTLFNSVSAPGWSDTLVEGLLEPVKLGCAGRSWMGLVDYWRGWVVLGVAGRWWIELGCAVKALIGSYGDVYFSK